MIAVEVPVKVVALASLRPIHQVVLRQGLRLDLVVPLPVRLRQLVVNVQGLSAGN